MLRANGGEQGGATPLPLRRIGAGRGGALPSVLQRVVKCQGEIARSSDPDDRGRHHEPPPPSVRQ